MSLAPALLTLLFLAADAPPRGASVPRSVPTRPGLSWQEADSLTRKLAAIEERQKTQSRARQTIQVTQGEVNSYLNLAYAAQLPKGLTSVDVRFGRERIDAKGMLDIEQVRGVATPPSWSPLSLLGGQVPVEIGGCLVNAADGFGTVEWDSVYVASIRVPISVLEQMVQSATKSDKYPDGVDIHAPFRLPYSVNRVRVEPGKAVLEF
ncbi:MAG: hypothetical protein DMF78_15680 [Acidobacteria bacterium]|nr:MAG: hypothetical protein DMF78_15680 [Acidobacteriota bacterium]